MYWLRPLGVESGIRYLDLKGLLYQKVAILKPELLHAVLIDASNASLKVLDGKPIVRCGSP